MHNTFIYFRLPTSKQRKLYKLKCIMCTEKISSNRAVNICGIVSDLQHTLELLFVRNQIPLKTQDLGPCFQGWSNENKKLSFNSFSRQKFLKQCWRQIWSQVYVHGNKMFTFFPISKKIHRIILANITEKFIK